MRVRIPLIALVLLAVGGCGSAVPSTSWTPGGSIVPASDGPSATARPTPVPAPAETEFTLMNFNIEYGGQQVDFAKIVEAVKTADPDVVAIEEAEGQTQALADGAGYPYANVRNQIISKFPIVDPPGADGRYVFIELRPGAVVAVSNVHLPSDPYGPYLVRDGATPEDVIKLEQDTRLPAIQERLDVLPGLVAAGIPTFLTGDFNAPSHLDWTEATVGRLPQIKYPLAWPVSTAVEAAGFRDTYRELHPDPVTDPGLTWWAGRPIVDDYPDQNDPQDRIDLMFSAGKATPTDVVIVGEVGGPQVDIAIDPWGTDHRSVVGTFTVSPGVAAPYVAVDQRLVVAGDPVTVRFHGATVGVGTLALARIEPTGERTVLPNPALATATDGSIDVATADLDPADYEVTLMSGDATISITAFSVARPDERPSLTVDASTVKVGEPITVTWRAAPGSRWDWIGVYARGGDPLVDDYLFYRYTDQGVHGSVAIDGDGFAGTLEWPLPAGEYDAHYLLDDGYTSLATAPFTVSP